MVASFNPLSLATLHATFSALSLPKEYHSWACFGKSKLRLYCCASISKKMYLDENIKAIYTFLSVQSDSSLQESWFTREERSYWLLSRQMQAKSDDVSTHFLTDGVLAHAFITFSLAFTSISAMYFYIYIRSNKCYYLNRW